MNSKLTFIVINVLGGAAVLGSYAWGLLSYPDLRDALWGGVPDAWRGIYSANMFLAAAGYLAAFAHILRNVAPDRRLGRFGFGFINLAFSVILAFSSAWMPATLVVIDAEAQAAVPLIFAILGATAIGTLAVGVLLWRLPSSGPLGWAARVGWCFFALQTVVLDGVVWPLFFEIRI